MHRNSRTSDLDELGKPIDRLSAQENWDRLMRLLVRVGRHSGERRAKSKTKKRTP